MKRILNFIASAAVFAAIFPTVPVIADNYATGLIWDSEETIKEHLVEYGAEYDTALPASVDLTDEFPAPGNQGSQNSCVAWAAAYALRSHQQERGVHWGLDTNEHLFSPSYVYNQLCGGANNGIAISLALDLMIKQGVCTLASFPYNARDYTTQPNDEQKLEAAVYKSSCWNTISGYDDIKRRLAEGDGVIIGIELFPDFYRIGESDPVYDVIYGDSQGSHAVCLVGYDDNKDCYGGQKGAFKFINSWGEGWGLNGYGWISYDLLSHSEVNSYGYAAGFTLDSETLLYENGFLYTVSEGSAEINGYVGNDVNVVIPETLGGYPVTKIGDSAFYYYETIENITVPDSITEIGIHAFNYCRSLKSAVIGSGVTEIGAGAFGDCPALEKIDVHADNPVFSSEDGVLFNKSTKTLIQYPPQKTGDYKIPDGTKVIGDYALSNCDFLTGVSIPSTVRKIGNYAFFSCNSLPEVIIPEGVEEIGDGAFTVCWGLTKAAIPDSVVKIGYDAFGPDIYGFDPGLVIYCNIGSFAHAYADLYTRRYEAAMGVPTSGGEIKLTLAYYEGIYTLLSEGAADKAIYFAAYNNGALNRAYAIRSGEVTWIDRKDIHSGKLFVWDNMKPLTEPISELIPSMWLD